MKSKENIGLVPPQSLDLERVLLGCILVDTSIMSKVCGILSVDTFYNPQHQAIYEAMLILFKKSSPIDYHTVIDTLRSVGKLDNAGGSDYVRDLTEIVSASNYEIYARKLEEKAIGRRIISICNETLSRVYQGEDDIFELIGNHNDSVFKAQSALTSYKNITPQFVGDMLIDEMVSGMTKQGMNGIPFGVSEIDRIIGGKKGGQIITIGARTRHGKSAIAAGFMFNSTLLLNDGYGVDPSIKNPSVFPAGFLSMEMKNTEVFARLVSMEIKRLFNKRVPYSRISRGRLEEWQADLVIKAKDSLAKRGIYIDDTPALNTMMVKSKIMKMINDYGVKEVYIDYIQLISDDSQKNKNRAQQISDWYTEFKNMAKLFDIPITILSQVDRLTEKGGQPRPPVIADLKESGGIEEKSDIIILLYRHEVNDPNVVDEHGNSLAGIIRVDVAKHKQGDVGVIDMPFDVAINTFGEVETLYIPTSKPQPQDGFPSDDAPF
jgi:replicative DNA helicase